MAFSETLTFNSGFLLSCDKSRQPYILYYVLYQTPLQTKLAWLLKGRMGTAASVAPKVIVYKYGELSDLV